MGERDVVEMVGVPNTRESIARDLRALGVEPGMTMLVHSSLSALGWVCGGPVAVIQAFMDALTDEGTLVMTTQSTGYSDPVHWQNPPVPAGWWPTIRASMPAYDPRLTPARGVGVIPETFRGFPDVRRSAHPQTSFAAWGKHAERVIAGHALEQPLGDRSPLGRLYEMEGYVLLLGVGHEANTSLHLAETRVRGMPTRRTGAPILSEAGQRVWVEWEAVEDDDGPFADLGAAFEATHPVRTGRVGAAAVRLMPQRPLVDFGVTWLTKRRAQNKA